MPDLPELPQVWLDVGAAIAVGAIAIVLGWLARKGLTRGLSGGDSDRFVARQVGRFFGLAISIIGLAYALNVAGLEVGPLLGAFGLGGVALAFAAQDILSNFLAGVMIQVRRPFRVGEQVSCLDFEGVVIDVDLRALRLRTFDGLDVVLPNAEVLRAPIINHTRTPHRRTTLRVGVAYDTDLPRATTAIRDAVEGVSSVDDLPKPQAWVEEFADSAIVYAVHYWHRSDQASVWRTRHEVAVAIKQGFDRAGITIPFPQRTVWYGSEQT